MNLWRVDTLGKRLFALMWLALVVSHLAGYEAVHGLVMLSGKTTGCSAMAPLSSLPPTPGGPQARGATEIDLPS